MSKIAFLFPGQGSQFLGMGHDLFQEYDFVREIFDAADEIAKNNIARLCFKGPMEDLTETINLQPAITAVNIACLAAIEKGEVHCDVTLGHSLGEYSALKAARVLPLADLLRSVFIRGSLMAREAAGRKGSMVALIGLKFDTVKSIIDSYSKKGEVSIANHNSEFQVVISGVAESVKIVASMCKLKSARVFPLNVKGAWHSGLMRGVESDFTYFLENIQFERPSCCLIHNVSCSVASGVEETKKFLVRQICNPVLWYESICKLVMEEVEVFVEIGPGKILSGLLKRILPRDYSCRVFNVGDMKTLEYFLREMS